MFYFIGLKAKYNLNIKPISLEIQSENHSSIKGKIAGGPKLVSTREIWLN